MKKYIKPSVEIVDFGVATIISASVAVNDNITTDSDANMINSGKREWGDLWNNH